LISNLWNVTKVYVIPISSFRMLRWC
jgi:hypothetical protein